MKELPLPSVHKSVSKPAPARLPSEHPALGNHTWLLNGHLQWWQQQGHAADIYLNISPTSRYAACSPHFLHSHQKKRTIFFLPSWLTLKKTFLLFVCTDPAVFVPPTMHSLFTEKKVDLKEIYRTFPCACLLHREKCWFSSQLLNIPSTILINSNLVATPLVLNF